MKTFELQTGNSKLNTYAEWKGYTHNQVVGIAFPAGHSCIFAHACLAKPDRITGKITKFIPLDIPENEVYSCFDARGNARHINSRKLVWRNFDLAKEIVHDLPLLIETLEMSIHSLDNSRSKIKSFRIGAGGETYFHMNMYKAMREVSSNNRNVDFWGYSKNYAAVKHLFENPLSNMQMVYSIGGKPDKDKIMLDLNIPHCRVVKTYEQAASHNLPVICDGEFGEYVNDKIYIENGWSYAIIEH
jgi:hypothetical protein